MSRPRLVALTLCAACILIDGVFAQAAPQLIKGSRVRVIIPAADGQPRRSVVGSLVRLERDTVVIWTSFAVAAAETTTVALGRGRRLETLTMGEGHAETGAGVGTVVGALVGAKLASAAWRPCTKGPLGCLLYPSRGAHAAVGALAGAGAGALLGFIIGSAIHSEMWVPVQTAGVRLTVAPGAVGIHVAF